MSNTIEKLFIIGEKVVLETSTTYWNPPVTTTESVAYGFNTSGYKVYAPSGSLTTGKFLDPASSFGSMRFIDIVGTEEREITTPGYYSTVIIEGSTTPTYNPNIGWNASARSFSTILGDGTATFKSRVDNVGAVVGLNEVDDSLGSNYFEISYGIYVCHGLVRVVESGVLKTGGVAFDANTVFTISRIDGVVYYLADGVLLYTSLVPTTAELLVDVSLYAGGDAIYDTTLADTTGAVASRSAALTTTSTLTATPKASAALTATSSMVFVGPYTIDNDVYASAELTATSALEVIQDFGEASLTAASAMTATSHHVTEIRASMSPMRCTATNRAYTEINASFGAMTCAASSGEIQVAFSYAASTMSPMTASVHCLTGGNTLDTVQAMSPMTCMAADHAYAEISVGMSPMTALLLGENVVPDNPYSGCAAIMTPFGVGSGSLLEGGRAILTAAHVVYGVVPGQYQSLGITFYNQGVLARPVVTDIVIHPGYVHDAGDYDIAILILRDEVSPSIRRYPLYTGSDEVGKVFTRMGKSPYVNPATGEKNQYQYEWHFVTNKYEALIQKQNENASIAASVGVLVHNSQLVYDYDDGTTARDVMGGLFGISNLGVPQEAGGRPGDSGAAAFIDGKIAGVMSAAIAVEPYSVSPLAVGAYGEINNDMRVSYFADWITSTVDLAIPAFPHVLNAQFVTLTVSGTGHTSTPNGADLPFIGLTATGYGGGRGALSFFDSTLSGTGTFADIGTADLPFATFTLSATGTTFGTGDGNLGFISSTLVGNGGAVAAFSAPSFGISGTGTHFGGGTAVLPFVSLSLSGTGTRQESGSASIPFVTFSTTWGYADLTGPAFTLSGIGSAQLSNSIAYVLNVHTGESTTYSNYPFMHIIHIGNKAYGVRSDGLYLLEGATDNGTAINGSITTKETDMGSANHSQNVSYMYLNNDTRLMITPIVDGVQKTAFPTDFNGRRCKLAKGNRGRYHRFKIDGIVQLEGLEFESMPLQRRVK